MKKQKDPHAPPAWSRKTLSAVLDHFLAENCPGLGGALTRNPVVKRIIEIVDECLPATERLRPGQMTWLAVAEDETAGYGKRLEHCRLKPVIVDLINMDDLDHYLAGLSKRERQTKVAVRLFSQAKAQGGVLTHADVAAMMRLAPGTISRYILEYERVNKAMVPRRGNIHDMGPTLTHKRVICRKHCAEGKTIEQTARETHHSSASVTRYVNDFKRVQACLKANWMPSQAAFATGLSLRLVGEYLELLNEGKNKEEKNDRHTL